jgi:hypothetical protein
MVFIRMLANIKMRVMIKISQAIVILISLITTNLLAQSTTFEWAISTGGINQDIGQSITTDPFGNVYITGRFHGTVDFDPGVGIINLMSINYEDIFIQKLDPSGNLIWAKSIGGTGWDEGKSIVSDPLGNVYISGFFQNTVDFDPNIGVSNLTASGGQDSFLQKLDSAGNLIWVKGGIQGQAGGIAISTDNSGNTYAIGIYGGTKDFDPGIASFTKTSNGFEDIFIQKLDNNGNLLWVKFIGGTGSDQGLSINSDSSNNIYITGFFSGIVDFDPGLGITNLTSAGDGDVFIQKIDSNGNLIWVKSVGGLGHEIGWSIATDNSKNIYVSGIFLGTADFDPGIGTTTLTPIGGSDIFIQKLDSNGNLIWVKSIGGAGYEEVNSSIIDNQGNIFITGSFQNIVDFDPGVGTTNLTSMGNSDVFVQNIDPNGNLIWAKSVGGAGADIGYATTIDSSDNLYLTGLFSGTSNFNPNGIYNLTSNGQVDAFVLKLGLVTNINTFKNEPIFNIYPNPTSFQLNIVNNMLLVNKIIIIDITGKIIMTTKGNTKTINVADLSDGIYFIILVSDENTITKKFVKQ